MNWSKSKVGKAKAWEVETEWFHGVVRSGFEAEFVMQIQQPFSYEGVSLPYKRVTTHRYHPDFIFKKKAGGYLHIELKGRFTAADRRKMLDVKAAYSPSLDIRMVFRYGHTPINKGSKTTYAMWCEKNGFPWAETRGGKTLIMPENWLQECET